MLIKRNVDGHPAPGANDITPHFRPPPHSQQPNEDPALLSKEAKVAAARALCHSEGAALEPPG